MTKIPQHLGERAISMLIAGMTMNVVAMIIGFLLLLFDSLGNVCKQQGIRKNDHVVAVSASRRVAKTTIFETPTCTNCHSFQIATVTGPYNNRIFAQTVRNRLREGRLSARRPYVDCVLARRHRVNRVYVHANAGLDNKSKRTTTQNLQCILYTLITGFKYWSIIFIF